MFLCQDNKNNEIKSYEKDINSNKNIKYYFTYEGVKIHEQTHVAQLVKKEKEIISKIPPVKCIGPISNYEDALRLYRAVPEWMALNNALEDYAGYTHAQSEIEAYYKEWNYYAKDKLTLNYIKQKR